MVYKLPKEAIADDQIDADKISANLMASWVPINGIIMWSGTIAEAEALTTYGIIGIKVWIYKGEVFSNKKNLKFNLKYLHIRLFIM